MLCIFLNDRGKQSEDLPKEFRRPPKSPRPVHARGSQIDAQSVAGRERHSFVKTKVVRVSLNACVLKCVSLNARVLKCIS